MGSSQRTKDQHFIPRGYLRLFSRDEKTIWVYDKVTGEVRPQSIKATGFIKNFYLSWIHPSPLDVSPVPELEGKARSIIKKIDLRAEPSPEELGVVLNLISLQFLR